MTLNSLWKTNFQTMDPKIKLSFHYLLSFPHSGHRCSGKSLQPSAVCYRSVSNVFGDVFRNCFRLLPECDACCSLTGGDLWLISILLIY